MKALNALAVVLLIVGGLNWGLVVLAEFDLVAWPSERTSARPTPPAASSMGSSASPPSTASPSSRAAKPALAPAPAELAPPPPRHKRNPNAKADTPHRRPRRRARHGGRGARRQRLRLNGPAGRQATKNIVQTAVAAGDFDTLVSLVKRAGLAKALSGKGPFTVFAPTDAAFKKVPASTLEALLKDRAALRNVLLYHVAGGRYPAKRVAKQK